MESREEHYLKMTNTPVPSLIIKLACPTIVSMLVSSIYNMADTFFVSQIGTAAAGAVGITFSIMAIIQAIAFSSDYSCLSYYASSAHSFWMS